MRLGVVDRVPGGSFLILAPFHCDMTVLRHWLRIRDKWDGSSLVTHAKYLHSAHTEPILGKKTVMLNEEIEVCNGALIVLIVEKLSPLGRMDLTVSERIAQQTNTAVTLVHEIMVRGLPPPISHSM